MRLRTYRAPFEPSKSLELDPTSRVYRGSKSMSPVKSSKIMHATLQMSADVS